MKEGVGLDRFLFEELKAGNTRAFDKIFNDHYPNLCRFAYSIVHDEDTAHSLVQHVFVKLWENRTALDHVERLTPYLTAMTRNHSLNFVKREKRNIQLADIPVSAQTGNTTENLTNKEIASKMEISTKGVEALIGRALKSLRISLADYLPSAKKGRSQNPILFALIRIAKATWAGFKESPFKI